MPRVTRKVQLINQLEAVLKVQIKEAKQRFLYYNCEDEYEDYKDQRLLNLYKRLKRNRFAFRSRIYQKQRKEAFDWDDVIDENSSTTNDDEFLLLFRLTREQFWKLYEKIQHHQVF